MGRDYFPEPAARTSAMAIYTKKKVTAQSYEDEAVGTLECNDAKLWISRVILRPKVVCGADAGMLEQLHHLAHEACFLTGLSNTDVKVESREAKVLT